MNATSPDLIQNPKFVFVLKPEVMSSIIIFNSVSKSYQISTHSKLIGTCHHKHFKISTHHTNTKKLHWLPIEQRIHYKLVVVKFASPLTIYMDFDSCSFSYFMPYRVQGGSSNTYSQKNLDSLPLIRPTSALSRTWIISLRSWRDSFFPAYSPTSIPASISTLSNLLTDLTILLKLHSLLLLTMFSTQLILGPHSTGIPWPECGFRLHQSQHSNQSPVLLFWSHRSGTRLDLLNTWTTDNSLWRSVMHALPSLTLHLVCPRGPSLAQSFLLSTPHLSQPLQMPTTSCSNSMRTTPSFTFPYPPRP